MHRGDIDEPQEMTKRAKPDEKKHWRPVTDPVEVAALKLAGKWKVGIPLWRNVDGNMWAECGDFKLWRDALVQEGKNRCQK
jgi:hypothetical protein